MRSPKPNNRTVILADAFTRSGLAVARALGRHGVRVVTVSRTRHNPVTWSRFVDQRLVGPDPLADGHAYASFVAESSRYHGACLVIPVTDTAVAALNERRSTLPAATRLALPDAEAVRAILDKRLNLERVRAAGIPCPEDYGRLTRKKLDEEAVKLHYPVVLKNADPDNDDLRRPFPFRVARAKNRQELEELLDRVQHCDSDVLFQQLASGRVINICIFAIDGEVLGMHGYVSLRRTLHEGIAREIVPLRDDIEHHARNLMAALGWTGIAHVQFLIDADTGEPRYMETNGRFWASIQGSVNAGWNFPVWQYEYFVHGKTPDIPAVPLGSRTVYRKADLLQLVRYWFGGRSPSVIPRSRLQATWDVLRDFSRSVQSDVGSWSDPLPPLQDALDTFRISNFRKLSDRW